MYKFYTFEFLCPSQNEDFISQHNILSNYNDNTISNQISLFQTITEEDAKEIPKPAKVWTSCRLDVTGVEV